MVGILFEIIHFLFIMSLYACLYNISYVFHSYTDCKIYEKQWVFCIFEPKSGKALTIMTELVLYIFPNTFVLDSTSAKIYIMLLISLQSWTSEL